MLLKAFQILTFLHKANVRPVQWGLYSCERLLVSKFPSKSLKEMGESLAETTGEEDVIVENSIVFTPEVTTPQNLG